MRLARLIDAILPSQERMAYERKFIYAHGRAPTKAERKAAGIRH